MKNNLLITATIKPNTNVKVAVSSAEVRLETYLDMLKFWLNETNVDEIVFCENSGYEFDKDSLTKEAQNTGKKLELLTFVSSKEAMEKGKGFAEGEIFKYAIKNSMLIKSWTNFYKVSGRIKILNINKIFNLSLKKDCLGILAAPRSTAMDTRFFKVSTKYFKEHLLDEFKKVNDSEGNYLEHVYFNKIALKGGFDRFSVYPNIAGTSGSTGDLYTKSTFDLVIRELALRAGFYNLPTKS